MRENGLSGKVAQRRILLSAAGCLWLVGAWATLIPAQVQLPGTKPAATPAAQPAAAPGQAAPAARPVLPGQPGATATPAQPPKPATKPASPKAGTKAAQPEEKKPPAPPEPEVVFLDTKDNWRLHCLYYPPMEKIRKGTQVVPIILLHGWGGQGSDYSYLATGLQTYGHACIVPDLRGHGRSTSRKKFDGTLETIRFDDLKPQDMENMVLDVEAVKRHLLDRNNAGEVNIEMLSVIAADVGCIVALNWAALDWSWPLTPAFKQGQDVKTLVLLSPTQSYKRMNANAALNTPAVSRQLSILFAVGEEDRSAFSETNRLHSRLERIRPPVPSDPQAQLRLKDLFLIRAPTTLQGTKLTAQNLPVNRAIVTFLQMRLLERREEFPWSERKSPLGG